MGRVSRYPSLWNMVLPLIHTPFAPIKSTRPLIKIRLPYLVYSLPLLPFKFWCPPAIAIGLCNRPPQHRHPTGPSGEENPERLHQGQ